MIAPGQKWQSMTYGWVVTVLAPDFLKKPAPPGYQWVQEGNGRLHRLKVSPKGHFYGYRIVGKNGPEVKP